MLQHFLLYCKSTVKVLYCKSSEQILATQFLLSAWMQKHFLFIFPALPSKVFSDAPPSYFRITELNFWCPNFFFHQYILCHLPKSLICSLSIVGESYNWSIFKNMLHKDTLKARGTVWIPTYLKFMDNNIFLFLHLRCFLGHCHLPQSPWPFAIPLKRKLPQKSIGD